MIDRDHPLSVVRQAKLLDISRGAVYYQPRPTSGADLALMRRIDELHMEHPFMGARMLRRVLARQGIFVGRRHLGTLMQRMGIQALCPQPGTSQRHPQHKVYPYLLRKVAIGRANQVWALDTIYIPMARGFVYLTAVVDVASRKVLAHKVAITLVACHAREIHEQAFARYGVPEIVNTDHVCPVHRRGVHPCRALSRRAPVHGRQSCLVRQRVRREAVAHNQVRAGIPARL